MSTEPKLRHFSMANTMRITARHMRKSVDISIRNTFAQVERHADDRAKSEEIFKTLSWLHQWRQKIDDFQKENSSIFKGK